MPEIASLLPAFLAGTLFFLGIDCYSTVKHSGEGSGRHWTDEGRLSNVALFVPFVALFYGDAFWVNLLATVPLLLLVGAAQWLCHRKGLLAGPSEVWLVGSGSYFLTILGYFMFIREGILVDSPVMTSGVNAVKEAVDESHYRWLGFWPVMVYLVGFAVAITRKSLDGFSRSLLLFIPLINVVPLFTDHYWWYMLAGFLLWFMLVFRMSRVLESSDFGAASMIAGYFYMLFTFGSIVVFGLLF